MEIKRGNTVVCDVYLKDNSYTVEEIMGEDTLILNFLSRNVVELQINDYIDFEGTKYKVRHFCIICIFFNLNASCQHRKKLIQLSLEIIQIFCC